MDGPSQWGQRAIVAGAGLLGAGLLWYRHGRWSAVAQTLLLVGAAYAFTRLRRLREIQDQNHQRHGRRTAWMHLLTSSSAALAYAWFMFDGYRQEQAALGAFHLFGSAAKDWMLINGVLGGFLAVFRSSATNSAALVALRQNDGLMRQVMALRQKLEDSSELTHLALEAAQAKDLTSLLELLNRMVATASDLPETSDAVDAFSIWIQDDAWRILAGRGISRESMEHFSQAVLSAVEPGKGIVANLAASGERMFLQPRGTFKHPWYAPDPHSKRLTEAFAAILLRDEQGRPCAALCLTSEAAEGIPERDPELQRFKKVLMLWAAVFTFPVLRYFELLRQE